MNPYEVLGVPFNAGQAEIKSAYRKLVKQFHPDVNKQQNEVRIRELNEAYDILSDPVRKDAYDGRNTTFTIEYEEDPRDVYRREYIARKREEGRRRKAEYNRMVRTTYKALRYVSFFAFIFSSLIAIDSYLPPYEYHEVADKGWQERMGRRRSDLVSFMQTRHFIIAVPHDIHIDYDYYATDKQMLTITVSPIFRIPSTVSVENKGKRYSGDIKQTIFSDNGGLHYIMLLTSLFVVLRKDYSNFNLSVAMFLALLLFVTWLIFF